MPLHICLADGGDWEGGGRQRSRQIWTSLLSSIPYTITPADTARPRHAPHDAHIDHAGSQGQTVPYPTWTHNGCHLCLPGVRCHLLLVGVRKVAHALYANHWRRAAGWHRLRGGARGSQAQMATSVADQERRENATGSCQAEPEVPKMEVELKA